jgi:CheY-like chemotaxis protein
MKVKIVWVDDEPGYLHTMKTGLELAGSQNGIHVEVITETDPRALLAKLRQPSFWQDGGPDVFFLDFVMPYLDGSDVANAIKERGNGNRAIVIYVTGSGAILSSHELKKRNGKLDGVDVMLKGSKSVREIFDDVLARLRERGSV